ncbi:MAG: CHASE4 domain-containing protein [Thermodesulfobacteriota bacterium]
MSLQRSVIAIIICTSLVGTVVSHLLSGSLISGSFAEMEEAAVRENVNRALAALHDDADKLDRFVLDWSAWDDTCRFIADLNPAYVESNLPDGTFRDQKLSLFAFFDDQGRMAWGKCFDLEAGAAVPFFSGLLPQLAPDSPLVSHPGETSRTSGIILLDRGPMLVASRPILDSANQGPVRGALVAGRMLDAEEVSALAARTKLDLRLREVWAPDLTAREADALGRLKGANAPVVRPLNYELTDGHALVPDVSGRPALLLTVRMPRDISRAGHRTAVFNLATIIVVCTALSLAVLLLLGRLVVWPISELGAQVSRIGRRRDFSERVSTTGQEELDRLAQSINAMLGELEESQRGLEARVQERTRELRSAQLSLQAEVAERRQAAEALQQARDEAVAANRAKSEFLANISHEVRTPLGVILDTVEVMRDAGVADPNRDRLENVRHAAWTLRALIDDILDLSRIEAGKLALRPETFDLHDCLKRTLRLFEAQAEAKGLVLVLDVAPDLPRRAVGAANRLGQVLRNLVGNAVKFTERGGVSVHARPDRTLPGGHGVEVLVRDTGAGIAAQDMGRLFETFSQIDASYAKRHPGSGLGLAISRRLVELMGGSIMAESAPGRGSVFSFRIPLAVPEPDDQASSAPVAPDGSVPHRLDVLLAEGSPHEREFLRQALEQAGHRVTAAGELDGIPESLARRRFDLVLLDVQDPAGQGLETLRRIRARDSEAGEPGPPVVALTPYRFGNGQGPAPDAGADALLGKPVELDDLYRTLARVLGAGPAGDEPPLDPDALRRSFAGEEDLLARLAALASLEAPDRLASLRLALERGDLAEAEDQARRLAAPLGLLRAEPALALAGELARAAPRGAARRAAAALDRLEGATASLLRILAAQFPPPPSGTGS